jgi:hypothetical protein
MKSLFEQNGGTYTKVGDYYIPNLTVPECKPIGKYGILCRTYLKNHHKAFYNTLFISGKLNEYLCDIDRQANKLKDNLLPKYKEKYGITEQLKSESQMEWVRRMNTIAHQIDEIILTDIVY